MKKILSAILMFISFLVLTSCQLDMFTHTHQFNAEWNYDDNYHWHICECGEKETNTYHDFGTSYQKDAENHWQACECGYETAKVAHAWDEGTVKTEPTDDLVGSKTLTCTVCAEVKEVEIPAKGHTLGELVEAVVPTCEEEGSIAYKPCTTCDKLFDAEGNEVTTIVVPALGHTEEVVPGKAATCEETGLTEGKKCSVCDKELLAQDVIPALGHTEEVMPGKAATCEETGLTEGKKCSVCDKELLAQDVIPALGHTWVAADCDTAKTCSVCDATEGEALGHTWNDGVLTPPTKEQAGKLTYTCSVCGGTKEEVVDYVSTEKVVVNGSAKILNVANQNTVQLSAVVSPDNATDKAIIWSSSDETVATVDQNGLVTAVGSGLVTISATTNDSVVGTYSIQVTEAVIDGLLNDDVYKNVIKYYNDINSSNYGVVVEQGVAVYIGETGLYIIHDVLDSHVNGDNTRSEAFLYIGSISDTTTWQFRLYPSSTKYTVRAYNYKSSNPSWPWGENKTFEGLFASNVTETGYTMEYYVPYSSLGLTEKPEEVHYVSCMGFNYYKSGATSYSGVVMNGHEGYTQGNQPTTTEFYHTFDEKGYVYSDLSVENITLNANNLVEDNYEIEFTLSINSLNPVLGATFTGTGSEYITEVGNGVYKLSVPKANASSFEEAQTITVVDARELGKTFTVLIEKVIEVSSIEISGGKTNMLKDETLQLTAIINPDNAADKTVTWSSSDETVLTVDANGLVTAVGYGKATITLKSTNECIDTLTIYVTEAIIDGDLTDSVYENLTMITNSIDSTNYNTVVEQDVTVYIGESGLYIIHDVTDAYINGDNTRSEAFLYVGSISDATTWQFRFYPSSTKYTVRPYNYVSANSWPWSENKAIEGLFASNINETGYTMEYYVPYSSLGLTERPEEVHYVSCMGFSYYKTDATTFSNTVIIDGTTGFKAAETPRTEAFYHKFDATGYVSEETE